MRHAWVAMLSLAAGLALQSGCSVPLSDKVLVVTNRCQTDDACGANSRCIENTCVTTQADLGDLIIEVEVPSGSPYAPATTHVVSAKPLSLSGSSNGYFNFFDIFLAPLVEVTFKFEVADLPAECGGLADEEGLVPIRVEASLKRTVDLEVPPGVATRVYAATTIEGGMSNEVKLNLPEGAYDLYMTPVVPGDPQDADNEFFGCALPPRLLRAEDISDGEVHDVVTYATTSGTVEGFDLDGWTVSLIENTKGRLLSDVYPLTLSEVGTAVPFQLRAWQENGEDGIVLRLTPPPDLAATGGMPVFYWVLANLPTNAVTLSSLQDVEPISISGAIFDEDYDQTVPSIINIHSDTLNIGFGQNVTYRRTIETDADGGFSGFKLLPGDYTFVIEPLGGGDLAVTQRAFQLTKGSGGMGQTLTVQRKLPLHGSASTVQGTPAAQMNAVLEPAIPPSGTYLQNVTRTIPIPPSAAAAVTDSLGEFSLLVDRGTFNLSLRPDPSSDLPWAVVSRFFIDPVQTELPAVALEIPNPVILIGEVSAQYPSVNIPNARIRAWILPSSADGETPPAAIQIAEATSQANGGFRLLLPGSLATISQ